MFEIWEREDDDSINLCFNELSTDRLWLFHYYKVKKIRYGRKIETIYKKIKIKKSVTPLLRGVTQDFLNQWIKFKNGAVLHIVP